MAQITVDTLNKQDRDDVMQALHSISLRNNEDSLFCPASVVKDFKEKNSFLSEELQKCKNENEELKIELENKEELVKELKTQKDDLYKRIKELELQNQILSSENIKYKEKVVGVELNTNLFYFRPENNVLEQTTQTSAPYVAVKDDDYFNFQFNEENALHQKAISSMETILKPFCEIDKASATEGKYVENRGIGCFSIINGVFKLEKKASVAIVVK